MVHDRVSHDHYRVGSGLFGSGFGYEFENEFSDLASDQIHQLRVTLRGESELDPAHHIGAVGHLGIERRPDRQDPARVEVEQLRHQGRCAEIHGDPLAVSGCEEQV
jgi:hypothetical protein